jgi:hypothetical protein
MSLPQALKVTIAATGIAQQLPNLPFANQYIGATLLTGGANTADITVSNTEAGATTNGGALPKGYGIVMALVNANQLWVAGTEADTISIFGS